MVHIECFPGRSGRKLGLVGLALLCLLIAPVDSFAAGITLGRYGGLFGHPNSDGGLSLYWCPARLSASEGGFISLDGTLIYRLATFDRVIDDDASEIEQQVNAGEATTSAVGVMPYGAFGYSIPLGSVNLAFAGGIYPAHGGTGSYDKHLDVPSEYPGAVDGPQRWSAISTRLMILHYAAGLAATFEDIGLSIGVNLAYVDATVDTVRARNLNRTDDLVDQDGNILEGRAHFKGSNRNYADYRDYRNYDGDLFELPTRFAFTAGISYENGTVRASATYRAPYTIRMIGPVRQAYATNEPTVVTAYIDVPMPHIFQTAISVTVNRLLLELITDFSTWSLMEENDVLAAHSDERLLLIPRDLQNTFSVRGNIGWRFDESWLLAGMIGVDPSAVPVETVDAAMVDSLVVQLGLGLRYEQERFGLLASYIHDIYVPVDITNNRHEPPQNGTFHDTRGFFNLSAEARF